MQQRICFRRKLQFSYFLRKDDMIFVITTLKNRIFPFYKLLENTFA